MAFMPFSTRICAISVAFFFAQMVAKSAVFVLLRYGERYDSKHSKRVPACDFSDFQVPCPKMKNACWDNPKPLYRKAVRKWKTEREIYR